MIISFVIPAHNEERLIGPTIAALHQAGAAALGPLARPGSDYEIIVCADACTDRTAELARAAGAKVVEAQHRQISRTRNRGAKEAAGAYLIFVDADTVVPPGAAVEAVAALRAGAIGGGAGIRFDGPVPTWARMTLEPILWMFRLMRWTGGCFLFCTRDALAQAGGWDEAVFAGEELYLCQALKGRFGRRRFVIIRERVTTSARKLRAYSGWELLSMSLRIILKGRKGVAKREGLDVWYNRREEPAGQQPAP